MLPSHEKRIWFFAISVSIFFHALFFLLATKIQKKNPELPIIVRLIDKTEVAAKTSSLDHNFAQTVKKTIQNAQTQVRNQSTLITKAIKDSVATEQKEKTDQLHSIQRSNIESAQGNKIGEVAGQNGENKGTSGGNGLSETNGNGNGMGKVVDVNALVITKKVTPQYPTFSRKRKEEGTVYLLITIRENSVTECKIEKTSGYPRLDEAARRAVVQWKFSHNGNVMARVPVVFKILD